MIKRGVLAALALAVLLPGWPAAQAAPAGQSSSEKAADDAAAAAAMQKWLAQIAVFSGVYQSALIREESALGAIGAGSLQALEYYDHTQVKAGAAWALDWAKARRLDLDSVQAGDDALPKYPPPLPPEIAGIAALQRVDRGMRDLAAQEIELGRSGIQLGQELISLAERTASGDADAAAQLSGLRFEVVIVSLRGENTLMQTSNAMMGPGSPQSDLQNSIIETNLAMIALMQVRKSQALKDGQDLAPLIADMRRHALAGSAAAQQAPLDAKSNLTAARNDVGAVGAPLLDKLAKSADTYAESAQIEQSIAAAMVTVADSLEKAKGGDENAVNTALGQIAPLVQRRVELDQRRKQIFAGQD